jgi:alpha-L-fucosidase
LPEWHGRFWWVWKGGYDGPVKESFQKFVDDSEPKNFGYQDYAHRFTAQLWQPDDWASIFARSGAQYVVLTSKHHEGFCNWDSRSLPHTWNWNAMDVGPRRDLVGDLAKAVKNTTSDFTQQKLHFGLYHSLFEWYNPMYREDLANNCTTNHFAKYKVSPIITALLMQALTRARSSSPSSPPWLTRLAGDAL